MSNNIVYFSIIFVWEEFSKCLYQMIPFFSFSKSFRISETCFIKKHGVVFHGVVFHGVVFHGVVFKNRY